MQSAFKLVIFITASAGIIRVSRESLRSYRSHGFYRFFAWEAVLTLMVLNLEHAFYKPAGLHQVGAGLCLAISTFLALHGFLALRRVGKPDNRRTDPALLWVEKTTVLVAVGAYKYIRHPLYCSFFFVTWGTFLLFPSLPGSALVGIATISLIMAAMAEEKENIQFFGAAYCDYMKRTKRFIPFVV